MSGRRVLKHLLSAGCLVRVPHVSFLLTAYGSSFFFCVFYISSWYCLQSPYCFLVLFLIIVPPIGYSPVLCCVHLIFFLLVTPLSVFSYSFMLSGGYTFSVYCWALFIHRFWSFSFYTLLALLPTSPAELISRARNSLHSGLSTCYTFE